MKIWFGQAQSPDFSNGAAVTIGNFDGVHLGHLHILQRLRQEADGRGLLAVAAVFEPQPQEFFSIKMSKQQPFRLSPLRNKLQLLRETGCLDAVWVLRFNQAFSDMPAQSFISDLLRQKLNARYLLIGDDFRFGAGRSGDFSLLQSQPDLVTERTPSVMVKSIRASSSAVRQALVDGNLDYARALLGHGYTLSGRVKYGAKLGRTIGCPTANVQLPPHHYALSGVFVVTVRGSFGEKRGVASFGLNPTVSNTQSQKLEVHIFDFSGSLYGERITVCFEHKLRDELKFKNWDALKEQIWADMRSARIWVKD